MILLRSGARLVRRSVLAGVLDMVHRRTAGRHNGYLSLLLVASMACGKSSSVGHYAMWQRGLRRDALGCFAATLLSIPRRASNGKRFFRLDSTPVTSQPVPGFHVAQPLLSI